MRSRPFRAAAAAFVLAAAAPAAHAQPSSGQPSPGAAYSVPAAPPQTIRLTYALYAHGFRVLAVIAELRLTPSGYAVVLRDHTTGFLGFMLHTDVTSTATGRFVPGGVQPVHFESSGFSRGAQRDTVLDYSDGNPIVRVLTPVERNRDPVDIARARGSIDTLAAMADMVHQVQLTGRCDGAALIFDGLRLTRASSRTAGQQAMPADDRSPFKGMALRCDFVSQEIGGFLHNDEEAQMRQPKHGSAWVLPVLPDAPALPARIVFENPRLGLATMVLTGVDQVAAPGPNG